MERTLLLIKPDGIQRKLIGTIVARMEVKGLRLCGMKMLYLNDEILKVHYSHLLDKPFFPEIAAFMQTSPCIATCWEGLDAVSTVRMACGITKAREALPGTIRGDYAMSIQANVVHASDSIEAATVEIDRFFQEGELFEFDDHSKNFVYSKSEQALGGGT
jgi:nucleoside-diphosphate kinase